MPHILNLRVRYFQDSTPWDVPCREENFIHREFEMPLPVEQTAFILVDMWRNHHIESWLARAGQVTRDAILPMPKTTIQCLGWWPGGKFQHLTDDTASVSYSYQQEPHAPFPELLPLQGRWSR